MLHYYIHGIGILHTAFDGTIDGTIHGALDDVLEAVLHDVWDGVLHGTIHGTIHGVLDDVLHGTIHAAIDGVLDGVLDDVLDNAIDAVLHPVLHGVLHGALHGALHAIFCTWTKLWGPTNLFIDKYFVSSIQLLLINRSYLCSFIHSICYFCKHIKLKNFVKIENDQKNLINKYHNLKRNKIAWYKYYIISNSTCIKKNIYIYIRINLGHDATASPYALRFILE